MKRFVFRLERVLGIRRFELERARQALALVEAEAARLARAVALAEHRLAEGRRRLDEETVVGVDGAALALLARAIRAARAKWLHARMEAENFESRRAQARELVRRCRARVDSLETLRDQRSELHRKHALATEQSELEELSLARFARGSVIAWLLCALLAAPVLTRAESAKPAEPVAASEQSDGDEVERAAPAATDGGDALPDATAALLSGPGFSRGVDLILSEVRAREVEIARRELELGEREAAAKELEAMVSERAAELEKIRAEIEARILAWTTQGQDRIEQLSGVYSVMSPGEAAELLSKLDLDLAVAIVQKMKKKVSASVLAAMKPERALLVSRRILEPLDPATDGPPARPY